ncbi:MAG: hypothetical protein QG656_2727, partial [Candidatus Hydrogenedentes bacterium]|nr:hypothetical protein [Candidatus Hydrogenedentota bacterium]
MGSCSNEPEPGSGTVFLANQVNVMTKISQNQVKDERVVEAVRHGLEGDAAVEFIHQSGHAMTVAGIARHLRRMGGRGRVQDLIALGQSNLDILKTCFPDDDFSEFVLEPPSQQELFEEHQGAPVTVPFRSANAPLYDTTKLTLRMPSDLY